VIAAALTNQGGSMNTIEVTRPARGLCVLALAVVLLATATVEAARASTIHACVKPSSGATRIVSAKAKCHRGEQKLAWSTTGPQGPAGASGSAGSAGSAGSPGAQGGEGKAGANGAGALFSATGGGIELKATETMAVTKTVPPGSYMLSAKADLGAESEKAGVEDTACFLGDRPGTTKTGEAELLDFGPWAVALGEDEPTNFVATTAVAMQGTLTSAVTSTLSVACFTEDDPGVTVHLVLAQLQALAVTSIS
jgi:hypothetical protein